MKPPEVLLQALCMACGLCCDGSIFGAVPVREADDIHPLEAIEARFFKGRKGGRFEQPCPAYAKRRCQIYADRPANCQNFRCKLLTAFVEGKTTQFDVQLKINHAISLRNSLLDNLQSIDPSVLGVALPKLLIRWSGLATGDNGLAFRQKHGTALTQLIALRCYLRQHFHEQGELGLPFRND